MFVRSTFIAVAVLLLTSTLVPAEAALVAFRRGFGGPLNDVSRSIDVDGNGIYLVGTTESFGANPPNVFVTIFNADDTHRCSVLLDLGGDDRGAAVKSYNNRLYVTGQTDFGPTPPNFFAAILDTNCGLQGFRVYDFGGPETVYDLAVEPSAPPNLYVVGSQSGAGAFVIKLNATLHPVWGRMFKVKSGDDEARGVAFSGGRVYVAGNATQSGSDNIFLTIFDANGNHVATRELATAADDVGRAVAVLGGEIYLAGFTDYPGRGLEAVIAKFDSSLALQWVRAYGSTSNEIGNSIDLAGGLIYVTGETTALGSQDVMLVAVAPNGGISHSFLLTGASLSAPDVGYDLRASGSCVLVTGERGGWPMFYVISDIAVNSLSVTVAAPTPSVANVAATAISTLPGTASFSPTIDASAPQDAFYTRFCPDTLVRETTTTQTTTTLTTSTSISTLTTTQTAYNIMTTTMTQVETTTKTSLTTATTTLTSAETSTATTTRTEVTSRTETLTTTRTITREETTTQTLASTSTVLFAEPFTTYILPALIALIAVIVGVTLAFRRRHRRIFQY